MLPISTNNNLVNNNLVNNNLVNNSVNNSPVLNNSVNNSPALNNKYGRLVFEDGTNIICSISMSSNNYDYCELNIFSPSNLKSNIFWKTLMLKTTQAIQNNHVSRLYKTNATFYLNDRSINFYGFFIKEYSMNMNGDTDITSSCDYYNYTLKTEQEDKRLMRKKKLERILKILN